MFVPTAVALFQSGGYTGPAVLFWLEDASDRADINRYRLVYSVFDGRRWSDPVPVYDDGTADFAPRQWYPAAMCTCFGRMLTKNFPELSIPRIRAFDGSLCCGASGMDRYRK